ncbi:putative concanavalin A-like lectin/glucanase domain-containing protein [Rosa chinensis]|uniref:Putative concanavalin A-like lectin/glucanase domain-containing protein n=1 Tax=Rosa chinensis TaxID=74649 RepID=A0A2P6QAF9_ROSCH|nr:putative concanavalin A-like lectin/glucanase domain-containing protein [Rosa chinensis]
MMILKKLQFLLLLLLPFSTTPLTFNFTSFPPAVTNDIFIEGDAFPDGSLRLTKSVVDVQKNQSVGRATYHQPFLLRQNSTGKLADFTSNFTFVIDSLGKTSYGNGLAFFIAPNGSLLNSTIGRGGSSYFCMKSREKHRENKLVLRNRVLIHRERIAAAVLRLCENAQMQATCYLTNDQD